MLQLNLDRASELRLASEARKLGLTAELYAVHLIEQAIRAGLDSSRPPLAAGAMADDGWERELDGLIEGLDHSGPAIPDEALRRDRLYEDRS